MNDKIIENLKNKISNFSSDVKVEKVGTVLEVGDGIARISGLSQVAASEMLEFEGGVMGVALNLEENTIGAIIFGESSQVQQGSVVRSTGKILSVPVGEGMIGRVVSSLGEPKDGKGEIKNNGFYPLEKVAPGVITRQSVNQPLQTGLKAIDAMIPIGRGQRQLIIGDRQTGKTAIALDTIVNQKGKDVICIYVAISQKESKIAKMVADLSERGAMDYTIIVSAGASEPAAMSYIAPYAGVSMAEYFMDQGKDVLIVYDDLSKHAVAYRQISLLLRRPPGREAYPGVVFYLHSRLLERAAKLNKENGGGSITALPIIETQAGDVSAYIPTNVISITDGQIYLETDLFYQGTRPALNVGISVSRVGSSAQTKAMKKVAGKLRLTMAQYRELAAFAQFGSDLDEATKQSLDLGSRTAEVLKQGQYQPMSVAHQVAIIYAVTNGHLNDIPVEQVKDFEEKFHQFIETQGTYVLDEIGEGNWSDNTEEVLKKAITEFKQGYK
jgi:F-type H+-transporting ATPase subunit alpha